MELAELLRQGDVEQFNATRGQRSRLELFAEDLAEAKIAGADLSGANLEKSDLTEADLTDCNLVKANLQDIDAGEASFQDVLGLRIRLRGAWLEKADLTGADFSQGTLKEAMLVETRGEALRLCRTHLGGVDAKRAVWPEADFSEAKFPKADFEGADLRRVILSEASGPEANFTGAKLDGALGADTRLPGANLTGASLVGVRLLGANLAGANLTNADLTNSDLTRANLAGATLTGARLTGAVLANTSLDDVDLSGVDLTGVDLTGLDPRMLGLDDAQIEGLATYGVEVVEDAPLRFASIATAHRDGVTAIVWINKDGEAEAEGEPEPASVRWALVSGDDMVHGVFPVSPREIRARTMLVSGEGFEAVLLHDRPGGMSVVRYPISIDGRPGRPTVHPVGYEPSVIPRYRVQGDALFMWGIARRGPTLVVQRITEGEATPVYSRRIPTAQSFTGRHHQVLSCKGGVVMAMGAEGPGDPKRTPEGYPGRLSSAVTYASGTIRLFWVDPPIAEDEPGFIRTAEIGRRKGDLVSTVATSDAVVALDAVVVGDRCLVAWIDAPKASLLNTVLRVQELGGTARTIDLGGMPVGSCSFADSPSDQEPTVVVTTLRQSLISVGLDGSVLGTAGF